MLFLHVVFVVVSGCGDVVPVPVCLFRRSDEVGGLSECMLVLLVHVGPSYASVGSILPGCRAEHGCIRLPFECSCLRFGAEVGKVLEV